MTPYCLRLTRTGREDLEAAHDYLRELAGYLIADRWEEGLDEAVRLLALTPHLQVAERESKLLNREVRRMVYQRDGSSLKYLLFYVISEDVTAPGGRGYVSIFHIRHGARRPMTRQEAQELRENLSS